MTTEEMRVQCKSWEKDGVIASLRDRIAELEIELSEERMKSRRLSDMVIESEEVE